jgi:hypothetical protein
MDALLLQLVMTTHLRLEVARKLQRTVPVLNEEVNGLFVSRPRCVQLGAFMFQGEHACASKFEGYWHCTRPSHVRICQSVRL